MTDDQIVKIAMKYLLPYSDGEEVDLQWWGKHQDVLDFAKAMFGHGYHQGTFDESARYIGENY